MARIGWALDTASLELGTDRFGWGYGGTAKKSNNKNFEDYGDKFGEQFDVVGNILDLDSGTISWTKNGVDLGPAFYLPVNLLNQKAFYPCVCIKNAGITMKFDDSKKQAPFGCQWVASLADDQSLMNTNLSNDPNDSSHANAPKAVLLEPSRELAEQTFKCLTDFKKYLPGQIRQLLLIGGISAKVQIREIEAGVDIVTGTIGRVNELVSAGFLSLKACQFFIIDEVDAFLAQGCMQTIINLHSSIPRMFAGGRRLQMIVCSATLHNFDVKKLSEKLMFFPTWVDLKGEDSVPDTVHHVVLRVNPQKDSTWKTVSHPIKTDNVHQKDFIDMANPNKETLSWAVKILKGNLLFGELLGNFIA